MDEKLTPYYLDEESLGLIVEALLNKIKQNVSATITSDNTEHDLWETIANGLPEGIFGASDTANKAVSAELVSEIFKRGAYLSYTFVEGESIETTVTAPKAGRVYLLRADNTKSNVSMWMYATSDTGESKWLSLGVAELPELKVIDTTNSDSVNNVVSHVTRKDSDYSSSTNVQAGDLVTAESLTKVLIGLGYAKKRVIPYSESQGKTISETVGEPDVNTIYAFQQTDDSNDWAVYTAAPTSASAGSPQYVWLKISGAEGGAPVEVDLSNYWSKSELTALSADDITSIVQQASEKVGI